jgi:hypothetical protein
MNWVQASSCRLGALGIGCLIFAGGRAAPAAEAAPDPNNTFLDALQGTWVMEGTLGGRPVRYVAEGQRVLLGGFLRLHLTDADSPPKYEAEVYIGFDSVADDYIAHWLDRFGAAGARVVATGKRRDDELVLVFPYTEGAFRDTFTWHADPHSWSLLLESERADGTWATFASYTLTHPK